MFRRRSLLINLCGGLLKSVLLLWLAFAQQPQPSKPDFGELEKFALVPGADGKAEFLVLYGRAFCRVQ